MAIIWNYGAAAQLHEGLGKSVWNWSGPAGAVQVGGTVRATVAGGDRVAASVTSSERVAATPRIVEGC